MPSAPSPVGTDACALSRRWLLEPSLASMLVDLDATATRHFSSKGLRWPGLFVISGYRTKAEQANINPFAPNSLHTRCPSLAADLRVGNVPASLTDRTIWWYLGSEWKKLGGRWGGSFEVEDVNHFDVIL